jgi:hypothetical protein
MRGLGSFNSSDAVGSAHFWPHKKIELRSPIYYNRFALSVHHTLVRDRDLDLYRLSGRDADETGSSYIL